MMLCPRCWGHESQHCGCCEGTSRVPDEQLSTHFLLSELVGSETAVRKCIPNDPPPEAVAKLRELAVEVLEPLRAIVGRLRVNSGYRSRDLNTAIGGRATSAHPEGHAADLWPLDASLGASFRALVASNITFDEAIHEGTWIHVGRRKDGVGAPRRRVLMMFGGRFTEYDADDPRVK